MCNEHRIGFATLLTLLLPALPRLGVFWPWPSWWLWLPLATLGMFLAAFLLWVLLAWIRLQNWKRKTS